MNKPDFIDIVVLVISTLMLILCFLIYQMVYGATSRLNQRLLDAPIKQPAINQTI